jgi:hypothetical protein
MARAKVAYYGVGLKGSRGSSLLGECVFSEVRDFNAGMDVPVAASGLSLGVKVAIKAVP